MRITSPALSNGETVPTRFTCEGRDVSPPLDFHDVPERAGEIALVVDDPDAPGGTFTHWLVWNLDPKRKGLEEGSSGDLGAREGINDFDVAGWRGPCPPEGDEPHEYRFTLYAVDGEVNLPEDASGGDLDAEIDGRVLEEATLRGYFAR